MEHLCLENARLRIVVDSNTGALRQLEHRSAALSLICRSRPGICTPFYGYSHRRHPDPCLAFLHTGADDGRRGPGTLGARPGPGSTGDAAAGFRIPASCAARSRCETPRNCRWQRWLIPYLAGIGRLGDVPERDELVHPYATGFLVRDPFGTLPPIVSEVAGEQPVLLGLYPEGFSGSTMQFMAYNAAGRGGFYLAAEDGAGHEKWLNFYRHSDGDLRMSLWHSPTDQADHRDVLPSYTIVLAALDGGSWYDAADRYKAWAVTQHWTAQGPLWARDDRPQWLLERVGACTFGINPRHDRTPWLTEIDRIAGTPLLHLLGPSWARSEADYQNNLPGGLGDWFPARFHPANLALIREHGDYMIPFEFDFLFGSGDDRADAAAGAQARQTFPTPHAQP